jgi:hypothetical protein
MREGYAGEGLFGVLEVVQNHGDNSRGYADWDTFQATTR